MILSVTMAAVVIGASAGQVDPVDRAFANYVFSGEIRAEVNDFDSPDSPCQVINAVPNGFGIPPDLLRVSALCPYAPQSVGAGGGGGLWFPSGVSLSYSAGGDVGYDYGDSSSAQSFVDECSVEFDAEPVWVRLTIERPALSLFATGANQTEAFGAVEMRRDGTLLFRGARPVTSLSGLPDSDVQQNVDIPDFSLNPPVNEIYVVFDEYFLLTPANYKLFLDGRATVNGGETPAIPDGVSFLAGKIEMVIEHPRGLGVEAALCPADIGRPGAYNPDGMVDLADYALFVDAWALGNVAIADLTGDGPGLISPDGAVNLSDFSLYLSIWSYSSANGCP